MQRKDLEPKFCTFCGAPLCRRVDDAFALVFFYCHHCGGPTSCPPRPSQHRVTQTPIEWAAFSSNEAREAVLSDFLESFSNKASIAMLSADINDDITSNFLSSPQTARAKLRSVVASHEEAILHLKRVHEAEMRSLRSQLAIAESLHAEQQKEMSRMERANASSQCAVDDLTRGVELARTEAVNETDRKWRLLMDRESALRAERDAEVAAAWRLLAKASLPAV
jgi:hypothetical protein